VAGIVAAAIDFAHFRRLTTRLARLARIGETKLHDDAALRRKKLAPGEAADVPHEESGI
jgi:hypothetical protein